jgi:hypothetical protein
VPRLSSCVLRGFNYWDITEARVVFTPAVPGQGSESASVVSLVDANEPTDGAQACPRPNTQQCDLQSCSFSGACQRENHDASMLLPGRFHTTTFVRSRCLRWSISTASARLPRSRSSVVLPGHEPRPVCCGASQRAPHKRFQPRGASSELWWVGRLRYDRQISGRRAAEHQSAPCEELVRGNAFRGVLLKEYYTFETLDLYHKISLNLHIT